MWTHEQDTAGGPDFWNLEPNRPAKTVRCPVVHFRLKNVLHDNYIKDFNLIRRHLENVGSFSYPEDCEWYAKTGVVETHKNALPFKAYMPVKLDTASMSKRVAIAHQLWYNNLEDREENVAKDPNYVQAAGIVANVQHVLTKSINQYEVED